MKKQGPWTPKDVGEFLYGTDDKPSDVLPLERRLRLTALLTPVIRRLKKAALATRVGINWQKELARVSVDLQKVASTWPKAKTDLAAPRGEAWCVQCNAYSKPCNFGRCPIRPMTLGVAARHRGFVHGKKKRKTPK